MSDFGGCDKRTYDTERQAKRAARDYNSGKPGHLRQTRKHLKPYPCPHCGAWHLTSQHRNRRRTP